MLPSPGQEGPKQGCCRQDQDCNFGTGPDQCFNCRCSHTSRKCFCGRPGFSRWAGAQCKTDLVPKPTPKPVAPTPAPPFTDRVKAWLERTHSWTTPLPRAANTPVVLNRTKVKLGCRLYCYDNPLVKTIMTGDGCAPGAKGAQLKDTVVIQKVGYFYQPCPAQPARAHHRRLRGTAGAVSGKQGKAPRSKPKPKSKWAGTCARRYYFDHGDGAPTIVSLGQGHLVKGVDASLFGACPGDTRQLRVPALLGYGRGGNAALGVPPDTLLFYQVNVLQVLPTGMGGAAHYNLTHEIARCEPGQAWSWVKGRCANCTSGTMQPGRGQTGCYDCPTGTSSVPGATECTRTQAREEQLLVVAEREKVWAREAAERKSVLDRAKAERTRQLAKQKAAVAKEEAAVAKDKALKALQLEQVRALERERGEIAEQIKRAQAKLQHQNEAIQAVAEAKLMQKERAAAWKKQVAGSTGRARAQGARPLSSDPGVQPCAQFYALEAREQRHASG